MSVRDSDAMELVAHAVVESETEAESLDLIEVKSPSISVSVSQIYADRDCQDSDLTSFILLPSEDTDDGALIRYFEETSAAEDNVMEARNMTNMNEDVSGSESSHLYTASSFSSPHTFNSSSPLSVSSPSLYNKWNGSRHDKNTK